MPSRRAFSRHSIAWRLPAVFTGLLLVVTSILTTAAFLQVRGAVRLVAQERLVGLSRQLSDRLGAQGRPLPQRARALADEPALRAFLRSPDPGRRPALDAVMGRAEPRDSLVVAVELLDAAGARRAAVGAWADRVAASTADLASALAAQDSAALGPLRVAADTVVYPTTAVVADRSARAGFVVQWRRAGAGQRGESPVARLIGSEVAFYIGGSGGAWVGQNGAVAAAPAALPVAGTVGSWDRPGLGRVIGALAAVPGTPWQLLIEFPERVVLAPVRRFTVRIALIGLVLTLLGAAGITALSRRIAGPILDLTDAAADLSGTGAPRPVQATGHDEVAQLAIAFNAMAERVDTEVQARRTSERQWRMLFDANPHPMWVFDSATLRFLAVNEAAIRQYGYSRDTFMAMTLKDIRPAEEVPRLLADLARGPDGPKDTGVWRHRRMDGSLLDAEVVSHPLVFGGRDARLVLAQDVTERRRLEVQLRQAQKMEAVGRLAGGVAHDFNNALAVILTYAELLEADTADGRPPDAAQLVAIRHAAEHALTLTRQLLTFSRRRLVQPVDLDVNEAVRGVEQMLRRLIGEDIDFRIETADDAGAVHVDPGQLEQVLINLAVNARDAMPSGGTLTISTGHVELDAASARLHGLPSPGHWTLIAVADSGVGMTSETRAHLFEPFFTTKEEGKGTGLGLATVYGIVTQGGGHVTAYSEPGLGTTFRVYLPRRDRAAPARPAAPAPAARGAESILVVEDDAAVRAMALEVLERQGYQVLAASGAEDALALARRPDLRLDLVMSDVVMGKMDGPTLVARLRDLRPGLRALLMSGYAGDTILARGVRTADLPFIEKPFTVRALAAKVREILDAPPREG